LSDIVRRVRTGNQNAAAIRLWGELRDMLFLPHEIGVSRRDRL